MTENDYDPTKKESYPLWIRFETLKDGIREAFPSAFRMMFLGPIRFTVWIAISTMICLAMVATTNLAMTYLLLGTVVALLYAIAVTVMSLAIYFDKSN